MFKKISSILAICLASISTFAQQDSQYTQYMYNTININPAYAGSRGMLSVFGMHREQWVGMDGAPKTNAFSVNAPIGDTRLGVGISFVNDEIGPSTENNISADLSYRMTVSETYDLSFGIKGSYNMMDVNFSKLNIYNTNDPRFQNNIDHLDKLNIGAGLYLHSDRTYVGVSVPNFIEAKHYDDDSYGVAEDKMHFYVMGGHVFDLSYAVQFKPAALVKVVTGAPLQVDLSANFLIHEKLTLGAAYRWDAAVSLMAGFQISDGLFVGYAYDAETTRLAHYNSGSHEIFLRFEWLNRVGKVVTPRFF